MRITDELIKRFEKRYPVRSDRLILFGTYSPLSFCR